MSYPGAIPPPEGFVPDLANPQDVLRTCNVVTQVLTMVIVTVCISFRVYAKHTLPIGSFFWEDVTTYASYILLMGYCVTALFASKYGGGLDQWEVSPAHAMRFAQSCYAATIIYAPMTLMVKISLLLIIARVFGGVHKQVKYGIWALLAINGLYYTSGLFIKIFICHPISAYWMGQLDKCLDQSAIVTADAIVSVISDLALLLLPVPLTCSLQMPLRKKLHVLGMLCAGGVATAFSVYRLAMIVTDGKSPNQTIIFIQVILSGNAEVGLGVITTCLPAIKRIYDKQVKGTSYFMRSHTHTSRSRPENYDLSNNIHVTTHMSVRPSSTAYGDYQTDHDEAGLVSSTKADCYTVTSRPSKSL
ncbi:hypothetical protein N3K66_006374 [Trichothecium roseum]|uniref:Uncharacterized protein n=1 Tax=Trichothecium roseum TaxID=47278 RepID=A0ACC0UVK0_9HYPO|nr:hypothetical protein N3K66_006374 [Trichothecium roseum]